MLLKSLILVTLGSVPHSRNLAGTFCVFRIPVLWEVCVKLQNAALGYFNGRD